MAKLGTLPLTGGSGDSYDFEIYPWGTGFNAVAGVYAITKRAPAADGNFTHAVLYVGETGDLSTRFDTHHKAVCFERRGANCIGVHRETSEDTRLRIEASLIARQEPPCNG